MMKLLAWMEVHCETDHEKSQLDRWKRKHAKLLNFDPQKDMFDEDEAEDDFVPPELLGGVEKRDRKNFKVEEMIADTLADLEQVADFLYELEKFKPSQDLKLKKLIQLLTKDPVLSKHKVLIFSEFGDTARYIAEQLKDAGIEGVDQIDSGTKADRAKIIQRFAPYYNESSSDQLGDKEIRVLVSTDVLSEGLNLQDATRLINYDLHWNPVRLMQRIGRVDRRMNPEIEARILADHPDQADIRGTVAYWNFLPPDDLDELLRLYGKVAHKTLRISKTLGIEGRQLLREDDDYEDLRNFSEQYEGQRSPDEDLHLEWQDLLRENPGLDELVNRFPTGIFSGKRNLKPGTQQVFFCFARPAHDTAASEANEEDILRKLVVTKRGASQSADRTAWLKEDLIFAANFGKSGERELAFVHFSDGASTGDLPVMKVLGWNARDTVLHNRHAAGLLSNQLGWPDDPADQGSWRSQWASAFEVGHREVITTSKELAVRLAALAGDIHTNTGMAATSSP